MHISARICTVAFKETCQKAVTILVAEALDYYFYILAIRSGTLYTGMTNNLQRRLYQHKNKLVDGFT